jgi:release factor glutamine methyltransferase
MPSVSSFLLQGAGRLSFGPHPDRARADAELLLSHVLQTSRTWLIANRNAEIGFDHWQQYYGLLERRYRGEPIQYITGQCEFYGLPFRVTPDVLIPRPETEHLVEKTIEMTTQPGAPSFRRSLPEGRETTNPNYPTRIIDVGTGSGAVVVALAVQLPQAAFTAIDISPAALAIARENAARNGVENQIRFLEGDLLAPVAGQTFDLIVSNPPYVPDTDHALIAVEVREHEPAVALFAGQDGLDIYRRLIPAAFAALVPGGFLLLEIGFTQSQAIEGLLRSAGFESVEFTADLQGIPRVASAVRP